MELKSLFSFLLLAFVQACHTNNSDNHVNIPFTNNTDETVVTNALTESEGYSVNWMLKAWIHNPNLATHPHQTNDWAISERYPSTFEEYFEFDCDTLYIYIIKQQDLELANKQLITSFNYTIYKCTIDNLANNGWKIIYPDLSEDYYYVENTYYI